MLLRSPPPPLLTRPPRYTESFDEGDFTVTLMFDSLPLNEGADGYRFNNQVIQSLPSLYIGMDAYKHGWDLLSSTHALLPDPEAHELITRSGYDSAAATVALQMCNNDVSRAVDELQGAFMGLTTRDASLTDEGESGLEEEDAGEADERTSEQSGKVSTSAPARASAKKS